jgi:hypothetical protein
MRLEEAARCDKITLNMQRKSVHVHAIEDIVSRRPATGLGIRFGKAIRIAAG